VSWIDCDPFHFEAYLRPMLRSRFLAIFPNFQRKKLAFFLKTNVKIIFLHKLVI
jgi:hypothetical protein